MEPAITPIALFGTHYGVTLAGMGGDQGGLGPQRQTKRGCCLLIGHRESVRGLNRTGEHRSMEIGAVPMHGNYISEEDGLC